MPVRRGGGSLPAMSARTDYTPIAAVYDQSPFRSHNPPDPELATLLAEHPGASVLDVACGTGSYLASLQQAFGEQVRLFGVDRSEAMLAHARGKVPRARLSLGDAAALPYPSGRFEQVTTRFAFHHFADKPRALDELARVLAPGGLLTVTNICPEQMPGSWMYRSFPGAWHLDQERFWPATLLVHQLEARGFEVRLRVELERWRLPLSTAVEEARRRDASHLASMPEPEYRSGLARLERQLAEEPGARLLTEQALLRCSARRAGS